MERLGEQGLGLVGCTDIGSGFGGLTNMTLVAAGVGNSPISILQSPRLGIPVPAGAVVTVEIGNLAVFGALEAQAAFSLQ